LPIPTVTTEEVKEKAESIDFITDWRQFITKNPYGGLFDWYAILGRTNKAK
jgi:DNA polymerase-3 subunit delta'